MGHVTNQTNGMAIDEVIDDENFEDSEMMG
jgi:hypothetical protein